MSKQNYNTLYSKVCETLKKYSLGNMAEGIEIDQIHNMVLRNQEKLKACDTFEKGKIYASEMLHSVLGFPMSISYFITDEADLLELYNVCIIWRNSILKK